MWRENVLKLMLDTHKRHIHRIIAESLEERASGTDNEKNDYYSMIRLFFHWKASGDTTKAASLALSVGESFINICMNNQAVKMFDEALDMWRNELDGAEVSKNHVAGEALSRFSFVLVNSPENTGLTVIIQMLQLQVSPLKFLILSGRTT